MHIILVSEQTGNRETHLVTPRLVLIALSIVFLSLMFSASALFSWLSVQFRLALP